MCNEHEECCKHAVLNVDRQIKMLQERREFLLCQFQEECEHSVVAEHDRGPNNHSVRICTKCTLKESAWVDEVGFSSGFNELVGAAGRTIKQVTATEIIEYETLKP